jgi:2-methylcitrate dehydratase PrpD
MCNNGSVSPTVVFCGTAMAQTAGSSGQQLLTAAVAGYGGHPCWRVSVGRTTRCFTPLEQRARWPQPLPWQFAGLSAAQMQHALGSAGTQSLRGEFYARRRTQTTAHRARTAAAGLMSACLAKTVSPVPR